MPYYEPNSHLTGGFTLNAKPVIPYTERLKFVCDEDVPAVEVADPVVVDEVEEVAEQPRRGRGGDL